MEAQQETVQILEKKVSQGNEKKSGGPKPQKGDPSGYNPGGEKVRVTASTIKRAAMSHDLMFDMDTPANIGRVLATQTYPVHTRQQVNEVVEPVEWEANCMRHVNFVYYKQACATIPAEKQHFNQYIGKLASTSVETPAGLLPLIRQFGTVKTPDMDWEVVGHGTLLTTMLIRSLGLPQERYAGRDQVVVVNHSLGFCPHIPGAWKDLREWCAGEVNLWCKGRIMQVTSQGDSTSIIGPRIQKGFRLFFLMFQQNNFPPHVLRAIRIGVWTDAALENEPAPGVNEVLNDATMNALNEEDVVVFSWNGRDRDTRIAHFFMTVQTPLIAAMEETYQIVSVTAMNKEGEASTMVQRIGENVYSPVALSGDKAEMAAMMATDKTGGIIKHDLYYVRHDFTPIDMIMKWFAGMKRGKKQ